MTRQRAVEICTDKMYVEYMGKSIMAKKAISATVTPLFEDGTLDRAGLKNLLERGIRHGLDGIFQYCI